MSFKLTKQTTDLYLKELSKEIKKEYGRQAYVELVLVGGSSVILKDEFRAMTTDLDGFVSGGYSIKAPIRRVAETFNIPNEWLNDNFKMTKSYSKNLSLVSKPYKTFNQVLHVRTVDNEYLVAMKLVSFRQYKNDLSDIAGVIERANNSDEVLTREKIENAVIKLYGSLEIVSDEAWSFLDSVLDDRFSYDVIKSAELETREFLQDTIEKYDDVDVSDLVESLDAIGNINKVYKLSFIMASGIPGAGKTARCRDIIDKFEKEGYTQVNIETILPPELVLGQDKDFILNAKESLGKGSIAYISALDTRRELIGRGIYDEDTTFKLIEERIDISLELGCSIVYDATNLDAQIRDKYLEIAKKHSARAEIIICNSEISHAFLKHPEMSLEDYKDKIKRFNKANDELDRDKWDSIKEYL